MGTYNFNGNISGSAIGDNSRVENNNYGVDAAAVLQIANQLVERLSIESPGLVPHAQVIQGELATAAQDGGPANRGRIRAALDTISVGVAAGTGGLALAEQLARILGL